jgi:hypothetical protein
LEIGKAVRLAVSLDTDALAESLLASPELAAVTADRGCGTDCGCHKEA